MRRGLIEERSRRGVRPNPLPDRCSCADVPCKAADAGAFERTPGLLADEASRFANLLLPRGGTSTREGRT